MDNKSGPIRNQNQTCYMCLSSINDKKYWNYICNIDGRKNYVVLCSKCIGNDEQFLAEFIVKKNTVTGVRCLVCNGEKKQKWIITKHLSSGLNICNILCSFKCYILRKRQATILCNNCNRPNSSKERYNCGDCGSAIYCSRDCQKEHYQKEHKNDCPIFATEFRNFMIDNNAKEICYNCFKQSTKGFQQCSGCKVVVYCSEICQKAHWKSEHKKQCKELQKKQT